MTKSMMFGLGTMLLTSVVLYGCGGGGDSPSPTPASQAPIDPNLTVPVQTALANVVNKGFNQAFTISGSVDNSTFNNPMPPTPITGSGHFTLGAGAPATSCGFPVLAATEVLTGTAIANGISTPFAGTGTVFYRSDNTTVARDSDGKLFLFTPVSFPQTVRAGDAGPNGDGTQISQNCTSIAFADTIARAYSVASDSATSLLVTFVEDQKSFGGSKTQTSTVYRIDTSGNIRLVSITAVQSFLGSVFKSLIFTF